MTWNISPAEVRIQLIARREIALIDLRDEANFARDHPLFASQVSIARLAIEALDSGASQAVTPESLFLLARGIHAQLSHSLTLNSGSAAP